MTWRTIAASEVDPDSPVTATLLEALADNPAAIAGGESGAPRIVAVTDVGAVTSTILVPTGYGGCLFDLKSSSSGGAYNVQVQLSDDAGSTWATAFTIAVISTGNNSTTTGSIDFTSGGVHAIGMGEGDSPFSNTSTATTPAGTVDALRFLTGTTAWAFVQFTGGDP